MSNTIKIVLAVEISGGDGPTVRVPMEVKNRASIAAAAQKVFREGVHFVEGDVDVYYPSHQIRRVTVTKDKDV